MHYTTRKFWLFYNRLPEDIKQIADSSYELLKNNPNHPSLHCFDGSIRESVILNVSVKFINL